MRQIQTNEDANGTKQHIFEVITSISLDQLVLGEGAAMEYIPQILLFNREFAFNIEDVLRKYLNDSSAS